MFYSRELLSRRGPLGTIWLAGSYLRKLSKATVNASNLVQMCDDVENPPVPLALPTQSTLLLGVVAIEKRKVGYLFDDAQEAQGKAKLSDRLRSTAAELRDLIKSSDQLNLQQAQLPSEDFLSYGDVEDLYLFGETSQDRELVDLSLQADRYRAREAAFTARPEDITLSQVGMESRDISAFDLDLGEYSRGYDVVEDVGMDLEGLERSHTLSRHTASSSPYSTTHSTSPHPPSPPSLWTVAMPLSPSTAEAEVPAPASPPPPEAAAATAQVAAVRRQRRKKATAVLRDEQTELSDEVIRAALQDTSDIVTVRPTIAWPVAASLPVLEAFQLPRAVPMKDALRLPHFLDLFRSVSELPKRKPKGEVAAEPQPTEVAMEEPGWEMAEGIVEGESLVSAEDCQPTLVPLACPGLLTHPLTHPRLCLHCAPEAVSAAASLEMELERAEMSNESMLSVRSYLGRSLDSAALEEERRLSVASQGLDESFRRRRDSRISVSGSFQTPDIDVPVSQFEIPRVEGARMSLDADLSRQRSISTLTEIFLSEIQAKIAENIARESTAPYPARDHHNRPIQPFQTSHPVPCPVCGRQRNGRGGIRRAAGGRRPLPHCGGERAGGSGDSCRLPSLLMFPLVCAARCGVCVCV